MFRAKHIVALALLVIATISCAWLLSNRRGELPPTEIFRGVTYQCTLFPPAPEVRGAMHVVIADLNAPGVQIYVTPMDPVAQARGWEYRLDYVSRVVKREQLAAAINGGYFAADSRFMKSAGDYAVSTEVAIADHQPCHVNLNSYMLWLDDEQTPHVEYAKPPPAESLRRARWAVSGQMVVLMHGEVSPSAPHICDKRSAIGFNASTKKLYMAVFEYASASFVAGALAKLGATDAVMMDGGGSTTMALGPQSARVLSGTVLGGWRPVATMIGIRAEPLK